MGGGNAMSSLIASSGPKFSWNLHERVKRHTEEFKTTTLFKDWFLDIYNLKKMISKVKG